MGKKLTLKDFEGQVFTSNSGQKFKIIEYIDSRSVKFLFLETGTQKWGKLQQARNGNIHDENQTKHRLMKEEQTNNNGEKYEVIKYNDYYNIIVKFVKSGNIVKTTGIAIASGKVPDTHLQSGSGRQRKLVCGWGINDLEEDTQTSIYYQKWHSMIRRVNENESYQDVSICDEWKKFSNFKKWMEKQDWEGRELDKDILSDLKIYSPETCLFVLPETNKAVLDNGWNRNELPMGVHFDKRRCKYYARINIGNNYKFLGYTDTAEESEQRYIAQKKVVLQEVYNKENKKVKDALKAYVRRKGYANGKYRN